MKTINQSLISKLHLVMTHMANGQWLYHCTLALVPLSPPIFQKLIITWRHIFKLMNFEYLVWPLLVLEKALMRHIIIWPFSLVVRPALTSFVLTKTVLVPHANIQPIWIFMLVQFTISTFKTKMLKANQIISRLQTYWGQVISESSILVIIFWVITSSFRNNVLNFRSISCPLKQLGFSGTRTLYLKLLILVPNPFTTSTYLSRESIKTQVTLFYFVLFI